MCIHMCIYMHACISYVFQSVLVIILVVAPINSSFASRRCFKLATESFWCGPCKPLYSLYLMWQAILNISCLNLDSELAIFLGTSDPFPWGSSVRDDSLITAYSLTPVGTLFLGLWADRERNVLKIEHIPSTLEMSSAWVYWVICQKMEEERDHSYMRITRQHQGKVEIQISLEGQHW